jgi:hypothetical protein
MIILLDSDKHCEMLSRKLEPFSKYYRDVRSQLSELKIIYDTDLPPGVGGQFKPQEGEIHLRYTEDAVVVAHEIGHQLQTVQGFPSIKGSVDARALNSALLDPPVDMSLVKYGFDLAPSRVREIQESRQSLERKGAPTDRLLRALWIANHVAFILDRHYLGDAPGGSSFSTWFESRYPEIAKQAELVAAAVISIGFDTPKKMFEALESTRVMLGIEGVVTYFGR